MRFPLTRLHMTLVLAKFQYIKFFNSNQIYIKKPLRRNPVVSHLAIKNETISYAYSLKFLLIQLFFLVMDSCYAQLFLFSFRESFPLLLHLKIHEEHLFSYVFSESIFSFQPFQILKLFFSSC